MLDRNDILAFEQSRSRLLGLAYRILGSWADAEDAVQDTFLKWQGTDRSPVENPASWLTTACTRRCIDMLRAPNRARVDYVGPWLPEPIQTATSAFPENGQLLASTLSTAFLLMLERLTPKERAAYLLHDIFERPYPEIARTLALQESTCRKLVSRARKNIAHSKVRHVTPVARQEELLAAFEVAISSGGTGPLATLLSDEIELSADSGGKVPTIQQVLHGKDAVLAFLAQARQWWSTYDWVAAEINGGRSILLRKDGVTQASISFAYDECGAVTRIYIMRNPDKLSRLHESRTLE
ncbi:sigma-70 family RNA polymerase sigma factor [Microvirga sp. 3-52]|uniref:sigma-70 family RNA polymerase sigma factor n=1 Tax=Microvirga sp. 3-52 TaxID=2792425 RepID=UPI001ACE8E20|nr:sigma-70 family RNA polymerase sigma factor [Microvirga sp. 3-52]MBO1909250.1 sigma-70 family RNA polymerase sigma factor [Microvirga sp. 3-52]MBS7455376.1 sigma-70 family RNA polymerase sigma factor [Microvirga sp. 3-52]